MAKTETNQSDTATIPMGQDVANEMVLALRAMQERAEGRAAMPDPNAFKATPETFVVDWEGNKFRHEDGKAIFIGNVNDK